jgi:hypothetical protein
MLMDLYRKTEVPLVRKDKQIYGHGVVDRDVHDPMFHRPAAPHRYLLGIERNLVFCRFANYDTAKPIVRLER